MIIGEALRNLFKDMVIDVDCNNVKVKYDHSNQDELQKFIKHINDNYPLIFYVTAKTDVDPHGRRYVNTQLIIMNLTNTEDLADNRTTGSFEKYIEPIYQECRKRIDESPYVSLLGDKDKKFSYLDVPNYGISEGKVGSKKSSQSVVTDHVDARIIDISLRIRPECIK